MGWQSVYDWFKNIKTPQWLKMLLKEIQNILIQILIQVGQDYITQVQSKIIEVSKKNLTNIKKFRIVFNFGKELLPKIKDSSLNLLIEIIYNRLHTKEVI